MNKLADSIAEWREQQGFTTEWDNMPEKLMLVVTEVAEAMEAYRHEDKQNFNEEIADTIIRLLDITGSLKIDIEKEIRNKMEVNKKRPKMHDKTC